MGFRQLPSLRVGPACPRASGVGSIVPPALGLDGKDPGACKQSMDVWNFWCCWLRHAADRKLDEKVRCNLDGSSMLVITAVSGPGMLALPIET